MKTYQHYYLIGNEIKKGIEKPNCNGKPYCCENKPCESLNWLSSLQPCEIDQRELDEVIKWLYHNKSDDNGIIKMPINITDIVFEKDGKIYFKHPKQVDGEIEAVELWKEFFNMQMVGGLDLCKQHFNITRKNI